MKIFRKVISAFRRLFNYLRKKYLKLLSWLKRSGPGPKARKGSAIGIFSFMILLMAYNMSSLKTGYGLIIDIIVGVLIGSVGGLLFYFGVRLALRIIKSIPLVYGSLIIAGFISLMISMFFLPLPIILWIFFIAAFTVGSVAVLSDKKYRSGGRKKIITAGIFLFLGLTGAAGFIFWITDSGTDDGLVKVDVYNHDHVKLIDSPDPSQPGNYKVKFLSYGSGKDRRDIFGVNANIITPRVDGKAFVSKLKGRFSKMRKKYWGFNRTKFPLNGRVWYPDGKGAFPLVLIVHGNHSMREYSDPGYEYLGKLLASRGYIFVSVDENFLNGDWTKNYSKENDARGWVLLEHLKLWRNWNKEKESVFFEKTDMDNICLIGHSRGGEAVSVAAAFNKLDRYPDDARQKFDYGFNIKSIIPISPVDGQYMPSDQSTPLENIFYLLFQGSHDADVSSFSGDKQYKRIKFTDSLYRFKTSVYIYRANHGQFNTVWGSRDWGMPGGLLLNTKELLNGEDQRQIAKVYISAFLDLTLKRDFSYLPLFKDYRTAKNLLPETLYINRFEDSETSYICDYDEDIDVTSTTTGNGYLLGENLALWREEDIGFRSGRSVRQNQAVYLGWEYPEKDSLKADSLKYFSPSSYSIIIPDNNSGIVSDQYSSLIFSIAQHDSKPPKPDSLDRSEYNENWSLRQFRKKNEENKTNNSNKEKNDDNADNNDESDKKDDESKKDKDKKKDEPKIPINFIIKLTDREGHSSTLEIKDIISIMPPLEARFTRIKKMEKNYGKSSEPVLQTVEIPMSYFLKKNELFNSNDISEIQFLFNKTNKGVIILDEIGFRKNNF